MTLTHLFFPYALNNSGFDPKWHTKAELEEAASEFFPPGEYLDLLFSPHTQTYSISGNTLTLTATDESGSYSATYTKQ